MKFLRRLAVAAILTILVAACSAPMRRPPLSQAQIAQLSALETWRFSGRLSLSDGEQGGSGRLDWSQAPVRSELKFIGTLGQGSWRLSVQPTVARLELSATEVYTAPTVDRLLVQAIGWDIPVTALAWWIKGLPDPAYSFEASQGDADRLETLQQLGWAIDYQDFMQVSEELILPRRIVARRGQEQLKLLIRRWELSAPQ